MHSLLKMSVLDLIVEKISNLKGYHGDHLDFDKEGHKLALLLPELKKYNIHVSLFHLKYFINLRPKTDPNIICILLRKHPNRT
jgi:hypothetical protein